MSADKIDHKAEALRLTAVAAEFGSIAAATSAATHATLYAAEQQRITNLIALFHLEDADVADFATRGVVWPQVSTEIVDGLGLA